MESEKFQRLSAATLGAYYATEWRARRLPSRDSIPPVMRPMRLEEAVNVLERTRPADDEEQAIILRAIIVTLAQLARADAAGVRNLRDPASRLLRAQRMLVRGDDRQHDWERDEEGDLPRLFDPTITSPNGRYSNAFVEFWQPRPRRLGNFSVSWSFRNRVTDVCASIDTDKSLADLIPQVDPRGWSENARVVWDRSDFIDALPTDIEEAPEKGANPPGVQPKHFYEVANFRVVAPISQYTNLLNMAINEAGTAPEIEFVYSQNVCLKSDLFLGSFRAFGGIDVDQGFGRAQALSGFSRITAYKRARFDQPRGALNFFYNAIGTIYLKLLIESAVLIGAVI